MVELRKRPAPKETPTPAPAAKRSVSKPRGAGGVTNTSSSSPVATTTVTGKVKKAAEKVKAAVVGSGGGEELGEGGSSTVPPPTTAVAGTDFDAETTNTTSTVGEIPETVGAGTTEGVVPSAAADTVPTTTAAATGDVATTSTTAETEAKTETGKSVSTAKTTPLSAGSVGTTISNLDGFGGTVQTHSGKLVTLKELLEQSTKGVVLFTYPKASTPGCTTQACLFRDSYTPLTTAGLSVYGLSTDSPKANTTFATKQKLPFDLLCDPDAGLTGALGLKKPGAGKGTLRGSVVISKEGKVEVWEQAGPAKTLEVVTAWISKQ